MNNQEFLESNTVWFCYLDDGSLVSESVNLDWKKFKKQISTTNLKIESIGLKFRDNTLNIFKYKAEGYYLVKGFSGDIYTSMMKTLVVGLIENDYCSIIEIKIPELIMLRTERRPVSKCIQDAIIWNDLDKRGCSDIISV